MFEITVTSLKFFAAALTRVGPPMSIYSINLFALSSGAGFGPW